MSKMPKHLGKYWIWYIAGLLNLSLIGVVLFSTWTTLKFDPNVNIIDFFSLIISLFFGLYIATRLQKNIDKKKVEKDIFFKELESIRERIFALERSVIDSDLNIPETINLFKRLNSDITSFFELMDLWNFKTDNSLKNELLERVKSVKQIVTGSSTENEKFILTTEHKERFFTDQKELRKKYFDLVRFVNEL